MSFVFDIVGSQKDAKAQKVQGRMEKEAAYAEAAQMDQNAKDTMAAATYNTSRIRQKADEIIASQKTVQAASGSISDGSARAIREKSIREATMDQLLVMAEAETTAGKDRYQAEVTRKTGRSAEALSKRRASATLLGGWGNAVKSITDDAAKAVSAGAGG